MSYDYVKDAVVAGLGGDYVVDTLAECESLQAIEDEANGLPAPGVRADGTLDEDHRTVHVRHILDLGDGTYAYLMEGTYDEEP